MPTYDYVCRACGAELELFQSITARPRRKCQRCGKSALERRIGPGAAILFRGSGFYQTDYRSAAYTEAQKKESGGGGAGAKPAPSPEPPATQPAAKPASDGKREKKHKGAG